MLAGNWFGKKRNRSRPGVAHQPLAKGQRRKDALGMGGRKLRVEELEDRRLLAVYLVNNLSDVDNDGNAIVGTLRQALNLSNGSANEDDTIIFADFLFTDPTTRETTPRIIGLNGGQLNITDQVQILGPGAGTLTISAGANSRIFDINIDADGQFRAVTIGGVTLSGGNITGNDEGDRGGAIVNREALTLIETIITGNSASQGGGGIFQPFGNLNVSRSLIYGNNSGGGGGGILSGVGGDGGEEQSLVTISNSTISGNSTFGTFRGDEFHPGWGGGVFNYNGNVDILYSTISENIASNGGGGVATYGVGLEADQPAIVTTLDHTIAYDNTDNFGVADDVFAVRFKPNAMAANLLADLLVPNLFMEYSFIGAIGGAGQWDDPGGTGHFYQVVGVSDGINWNAASEAAGGGFHLATLLSQGENDFAFDLTDFAQFWRRFTPTAPMAAPPDPQNIGPWLGGIQIDTSLGPDLGWEWVTPNSLDDGFLFDDYTNWAAGQPDDAVLITEPPVPPALPTNPEEDRLLFFDPIYPTRTNTWGDLPAVPDALQIPVAFVIEYDQGTNFFGIDPGLLPLGDYGGSTPVYYPNNSPSLGPVSPVIDAGDPDAFVADPFEQRGRHFTRVADTLGNGAIIDIGAVEVQSGQFIVDEVLDETDGQFSRIWELVDPVFGLYNIFPGYDAAGDFALREAIDFSEKNPEVDTITFSTSIQDLDDPTFSAAQTILLKLRTTTRSALRITQPVFILGPTGFELEVDATGNDPTPSTNNADGTRILEIDNGSLLSSVDVTISDLTLLGGDVVDRGGAISNFENLTIVNSTIKENNASNDGGGIFTQIGDLVIDSTTVNGNRAGDDGGGIFVGTGNAGNVISAVVRNSTISGNFAGDRGAGVYNSNGEVLIEYSTITANQAASTRGAGVASMNGANAFTQVHSSIISANMGKDIEYFAIVNVQSLGFNLIGNGTATNVFMQPGDQTLVLNPMIAALANTGGRNATHRLIFGSPAIDAGDPAAVANVGGVPMFDERGEPFTRVFDADNDTKVRIDIGAYELQSTVFIVDNALDENDGNISAGNFSLREAIELSNSNPLVDTITFDALLSGSTISQSPANAGILQPGTPTDMRITDSVTITGLGEFFLTFDGTNAFTDILVIPPVGEPDQRSRFFTIDNSNSATEIEVVITDVTFTNSTETTMVGGAIKSTENLTLERVSLINNSTLGDAFSGGAIYQRLGSLTLDGVTLTANLTNGVNADGGAVFVRDADLDVLNNTSISGNLTSQTLGSGGGIFIQNGTLNMNYSSVSSNLAPGGQADGAGIYGVQSVMNIVDSTISGNSMTGSNSEGAGIFSKNSVLNLTRTPVSFNSTSGSQSEGAGIYLSGGSATIVEGIVSFNSTTGHSATGAGIAVVGGATLVITDTTLDSNTTTGQNASGGAIHNLGGIVSIIDSTISNSSVSGSGSSGGAIFSDTNLIGTQSTTVFNSTISGNSSNVQGGGIFNADGLTVIKHSTITDNSVPNFSFGGGVGSFGNSATTRTEVYSSIIAGNAGSDVDRIAGNFQDTFLSLGYNVTGTGITSAFSAATHDIVNVLDPKLSPLQSGGGFTDTHALLTGSPAINAGLPGATAGLAGIPEFDQRGQGRVQGGRIDIGSFESSFILIGPGDFDGNGTVNGRDFLRWQRGLSPAPFSGSDLATWQANYGSGGALVAASVSTEDEFTVELAPLLSDEPASENSASGVILLGWIMPVAAPSVATDVVESESADFDAVYLAAEAGDYSDDFSSFSDLDFGDIATNRSADESEDSEDLSAGDAVFELIGAGQF